MHWSLDFYKNFNKKKNGETITPINQLRKVFRR